jgi:hypothetical protein
MLQEIKNEPPRAPSTPRNKKLRDLAQLHKETVLGYRDRILNLSLMVAAVLTLLWRQVPGVQELNRYTS